MTFGVMKSQFVTLVTEMVRERGLLGTGRQLLRNARRARRLAAEDALRSFDRQEGTETSGWVMRRRLGVERNRLGDVFEYIPSSEALVERVFSALALDPSRLTFVDYGCGKGRVLLLAARHGFQRVIGVEISPELVEVARKNVVAFRTRHPEVCSIEVVCSDAAAFIPPAENAVYYFYQPFPDWVMDRVLSRLVDTMDQSRRDVYVVHVSPFGPGVVERTGRFTRLASDANDPTTPWAILKGSPKVASAYAGT
jgi:SAM-dependent methyltransferase